VNDAWAKSVPENLYGANGTDSSVRVLRTAKVVASSSVSSATVEVNVGFDTGTTAGWVEVTQVWVGKVSSASAASSAGTLYDSTGASLTAAQIANGTRKVVIPNPTLVDESTYATVLNEITLSPAAATAGVSGSATIVGDSGGTFTLAGGADPVFSITGNTLSWTSSIATTTVTPGIVETLGGAANSPLTTTPTFTINPPVSGTIAWNNTVNFGDSQLVYSNSDLTVAASTTINGIRYARGSGSGKTSGKFYFEVVATSNINRVGIGTSVVGGSTAGTNGTQTAYWSGSSAFYNGGSSAMGTSIGAGDVINVAMDLDNNRLWFRKNGAGNWNNSGAANPATNTGGFTPGTLSGGIYPIVGLSNNTAAAATARFSSGSWSGSAPSGFGEITN
jgi:hypothetical protein